MKMEKEERKTRKKKKKKGRGRVPPRVETIGGVESVWIHLKKEV